MKSCNHHVRIVKKGQMWSSLCWGMAFVTGCSLLWLPGEASGAPNPADPRLSATLMGRLEPGAAGRLAVRWDGPKGSLLDVWVDFDGDGTPSSHELVAEGRPLTPGIEVVCFQLPPEVTVASKTTVWVKAREGSWSDEAATVVGAAADTQSNCGWQPGFDVWGLDGKPFATTVYDDGSGPALYVGGSFETAGDMTVNRIARWDGSAWSTLSGPSGIGADGTVFALATFDDGSGPALYLGGEFVTAGGVTVNNIARWDGSVWSTLSGPSGIGTDGTVYALAAFDDGSGPALYLGGEFVTAGGVIVNNIARWDGSVWSALSGPWGAGVYGFVLALAVFDDGSGSGLYAGGRFDTAGGVIVNNIARWDGSAWSALSGPSGTGVDGGLIVGVSALTVFDDGFGPALYVGGSFDTAGGVTVNDIGFWNGAGWSALSGPSGTGVNGGTRPGVRALTVFDDGFGPALYVGGDFWFAGGVLVDYIARWDGNAWSALSGPSATGVWCPTDACEVTALAAFADGRGSTLYVGGGFNGAGGLPSMNIAAWRCNLELVFFDGFESGDTSAWSDVVP